MTDDFEFLFALAKVQAEMNRALKNMSVDDPAYEEKYDVAHEILSMASAAIKQEANR